MNDLETAAIKEVIDRHDGFVTWFTGRGDNAVMEAMEAVFPPGMVLISPDASVCPYERLIPMLRDARGKRDRDFAITIDAPKIIWSAQDTVLVEYIERQVIGGEATARRSTALFTRADGTPNGVVWRHVHETWIDPPRE
ncbi:MAG: hypothetical protein AAGF45_00720 [Pseudomonadota bacterium]